MTTPMREPRVLVVEDDPEIVRLLTTLLELDGFEVEVAEDGLEGLVKQQLRRPDVALVDIMMPEVDGLRVLKQLIEEGDGQPAVPVIVITGSPDGARRSRELIGPDNVFQKPFDTEALMDRVRAVIA